MDVGIVELGDGLGFTKCIDSSPNTPLFQNDISLVINPFRVPNPKWMPPNAYIPLEKIIHHEEILDKILHHYPQIYLTHPLHLR